MIRKRNEGDSGMLLFLLAGGAAAWWWFSQQPSATPATATGGGTSPATGAGSGTVPASSGAPAANPITLNVGPAGTTPQIPVTVTQTPPVNLGPDTTQPPVTVTPPATPPQPVIAPTPPPAPAPIVVATPPPAPAPAPAYVPPPAPVPVAVAPPAPVPVPAQITSPANGAQLLTDTAIFQWSPGTLVDGYTIGVGTQPNFWDLAQQSGGPGFLTQTVHGLPTDGRTIYANVFSSIGGNPFVAGNQISMQTANAAAPPASAPPAPTVNPPTNTPPPTVNPPAATPPPAPVSSGKLSQMYNWLQGATADVGSHFTAAQWINLLASSTGYSVSAGPQTIFGYDPGAQQMTIDQFWGPMSAYLRSSAGFSGLGRMYPVRSPWAA